MSTDNQESRATSSSISGKVALITGSSDKDGIGFGIARSLARRGCIVILTGSREAEKVEQLRSELETECKVTVHYLRADLSNIGEVEKLIKDINQIYPNGVDILVNNAEKWLTYSPEFSVEKLDISLWETCLQINLTAPFYLTQLTLPGMKKKGWGKIVNTSSIYGLAAEPMAATHVIAKHGIVGLTQTVALETLGSGVTCNAICPAAVRTRYVQDVFQKGAEEEGMTMEEYERIYLPRYNPSGKYVDVSQIGELSAFLCSPAADQMTGTCIPIDAGYGAK